MRAWRFGEAYEMLRTVVFCAGNGSALRSRAIRLDREAAAITQQGT